MQSFTGGGAAAKGGAMSANPYLMAASGALEGVGKIADYQMQNRMYNRDKQQASRNEFQDLTDRMNQQRRRAGESGTKSALLRQMAMRLGLGDIPFGAARELQIKPASGTTRVDQQFKNYYGIGGPPRQQLRPGPQSFPTQPQGIMQLLQPFFAAQGGR